MSALVLREDTKSYFLILVDMKTQLNKPKDTNRGISLPQELQRPEHGTRHLPHSVTNVNNA
jgi:hypothetical protein